MMEEYFTQPILDAVARAAEIAQKANCSLAQLALAWCLRRPEVTSVITGATKPEQVDDNVAAADLDVDPRVLAELDRVLEPVAPFEAYTS